MAGACKLFKTVVDLVFCTTVFGTEGSAGEIRLGRAQGIALLRWNLGIILSLGIASGLVFPPSEGKKGTSIHRNGKDV